ncbi:hypothetical protein PC9H_005857 [Pleurotus ostreatus]|uniref:Uncharacterized protein n=1 Tax=Pleurotus ostreatus TaxID=5322 RepID=A0A8H7DV28_PLEOS|nr:uncharacterized protein PC9H_005857 [Pleurotus ostreatus]KAF7430157.1 hypothetical protein PC9H_005857 [Pleurotus ostreatus]
MTMNDGVSPFSTPSDAPLLTNRIESKEGIVLKRSPLERILRVERIEHPVIREVRFKLKAKANVNVHGEAKTG